ncbi:MAG: T9SS type A sorting domain-containing protein [Saprospiraceae bacterium]|nr:T9SS type A sorting domain-containing protein [Saprospiraceae bacterium]
MKFRYLELEQCTHLPQSIYRPHTLETSQPCKIEIYDITGHKVLTIATNENSTDMDIAPLHPGLYLIKFTTESGVASVQKFVKQ